MRASTYWPLLLSLGAFCLCCLWKVSIHRDLSISSSSSPRPSYNVASFKSNARLDFHVARKKHRGNLSRYMLQLYRRRPEVDVVRAIYPAHTSAPLRDGGRILEFTIPTADVHEDIEAAELLGIAGAIMRVRSLSGMDEMTSRGSRKDEAWRAFDVTSAVAVAAPRNSAHPAVLKLYVHGRSTYGPYGDAPILLLHYRKSARIRRYRRSARERDNGRGEEVEGAEDDSVSPRRRRRNSCRRRPMYVDFALIAYDEWVVAPPGYEAYQCSGKCFYPFGDHLTPTKHAIVQTLVHGALRASDHLGANKYVGRACCVPTRLAPTSLLYLDASGTLTYQYGYEDMVVAECGCR